MQRAKLHFACKNGSMKCVIELLNRGSDADIQDLEGDTPLDLAIQFGHQCIVNVLTNHKISNICSRVKAIEEQNHRNATRREDHQRLLDIMSRHESNADEPIEWKAIQESIYNDVAKKLKCNQQKGDCSIKKELVWKKFLDIFMVLVIWGIGSYYSLLFECYTYLNV